MPGVEDFTGAVAAVRATGATMVRSHHFVIDSPMTVPQVMALFHLPEWVDGATDPGHFTFEFENEPEEDDSLSDDAYDWYEGVGPYKPPEPPPCLKCQAREAEELRKDEAAENRPVRHGAKWEPEEDQQILQEYNTDPNVPAIARAHQRSEGAIWSQLGRLGVVSPGDLPEHLRGFRRG